LTEGSPQPLGDLRQALGEVDPQPGSSVHEVVLPEGSCGRSRQRTSRQLNTDEQYAELLEQMAPIVEQVTEKLNL
jgi:hypothetical protein